MVCEEEVQLEVPAHNENKPVEPLPEGKYTLVGVDIDTTGKRLIDEIVQIAAYTPTEEFSQYIMPLMNLNPAARQRHQVRVITVGFFRMLKSMQTYKVVKTKTEVAALNEFLAFLERVKAADEGSDGIILLFHESRKLAPYMIIEALKKYNLVDRFLATVRSFTNSYQMAVDRCGNTMKYFTLREMAKVLLNRASDDPNNKDLFEGNASVRARLVYEVTQHLARAKSGGEENGDEKVDTAPPASAEGGEQPAASTEGGEQPPASAEGGEQPPPAEGGEQPQQQQHEEAKPSPEEMSDEELLAEMRRLVQVYAHPVQAEVDELQEQECILGRQSSLRPIFLQYFKSTLYHRVKAVTFRRVLAEHGHDLEALKQLWDSEKRDGFVAAIGKIDELKEEERNELTDILDHHFDPEKQPVKPKVRRNGNGQNGNGGGNGVPNSRRRPVNQPRGNKENRKGAPISPDRPKRFFRNNQNRHNRVIAAN